MGSQVTKDETQLLIGGKWVEAGNGTYDIVNPATEQVVGQAPNASAEDAAAAAAAAREAFPSWAATPAEERLSLLRAAAGAIRAKNDELVPLVIAETGATASVGSRMQVPVSAARFDRYSQDISHVQEHMLPPVVSAATPLAPGGLISALAYRQPVGVVAAIASYNFPMTNMAGKVAPALAMGNTVIMKPAPQDPLAVIELARVLDEVGFPPGVINLVNSEGPEPASVLTTSPDVDMV
jgi:phenylacetaldehyde dehydrogenase